MTQINKLKNLQLNKNLTGLLLSSLSLIITVLLLITFFFKQWEKIKIDMTPINMIVEEPVSVSHQNEHLSVNQEKLASSSGTFLGELLKAISTATTEAKIATKENALKSASD